MTESDLIEKFKSLGFKEYEAKICLVLLKGLPMSASEIAKESRLIRTSIYDSLKTYVNKGYVNEIETSSILKYQVVEPQVFIDKLERDLNESNMNKIASLKNIFAEAQKFSGYGKNSLPVDDNNIELIRGYNKHRLAIYAKMAQGAKKEILVMNRRGIVTDELNGSADRLIRNAGVVRCIYKDSINFKIRKDGKFVHAAKDDLIKLCERFEKSGEQVRLTNKDIPNTAIFDGNAAIINVTSNIPNAKNKLSDIIIKNSDFVNNLKDMFEFYWQNSKTIDEFKKDLL